MVSDALDNMREEEEDGSFCADDCHEDHDHLRKALAKELSEEIK